MSSTPAEAGRRFRPRLWPTLATFAALLILVGLGTWQLQRLAWKQGLIAHAQAQLAAPADFCWKRTVTSNETTRIWIRRKSGI